MDIDERIEKLPESQEKTQVLLAEIVNTAKRLERIALSREVRFQDTESTLAALEGKFRNTK
jgi:hypothetical protein